MKNYEKESLLKNFFVFFVLLEILLILLFMELYRTQKSEYKQLLLKEMQLCSYSLDCEKFSFDFTEIKEQELHKLYDINETFSYFSIPKSKKYYMKISYAQKKVDLDIDSILEILFVKFILASTLLFIASIFFTFYSLNPIRKALRLNDEFVKDILHDFNTPITSMILNIKMFKDEEKDNQYIERISKSINNILQLQNNLKSFLHNSPLENETVTISHMIEERLKNIQNMYPYLLYEFSKDNELSKMINREALIRIVDNILSNAAKYNKTNGKISISIVDTIVTIEDTGKGITNVQKVFQRYYKEQDRGIGLGLHIVKKLCDECKIDINIQSEVNHGTKVILNFQNLTEE